MRITNVLGAFLALMLSVVLTFTTAPSLYSFIDGWATGDLKTVALIGMAIMYLLILIGLPIMIAVEDTKSEI